MKNLLANYANFKGRCARKPFWLFITITHCLLMLLYTPMLYLTMLWGAEQVGKTEYKAIFNDIVDLCYDPNIVNLNTSNPQISMEEASALVAAAKPIVQERLLPLIYESSSEFITRSCGQYPWCYASSILAILCTLLLIIPSNAITICRLRDAGFPPAYLLLLYVGFIPMMSTIALPCQLALLVLLCLPSKKITNSPAQAPTP